jgi:formylglycine-generating enzyme required for sulfatase activity
MAVPGSSTANGSLVEPCDVFVAYSRDAQDFSQRLTFRLRRANLRVFLDDRELQEGNPFDASIAKAVESCRTFLFVISARSVAKDSYARTELDWAVKAERSLLSIQAEEHDGVKHPPALDGLTAISTEGDRIAQAVKAVLERLQADVRRKPAPRRRVVFAGVAAGAAAVLAFGVAAALHAFPDKPKDVVLAPPLPDMARIGGKDIISRNEMELGIASAEPYMSWCERLSADEPTCRERVNRLRARGIVVSTFDLDRSEVDSQAFAEWMRRKIRDGRAALSGEFVEPDCQKDILGPLVERVSDKVALWRPRCCGVGAHLIASEGTIQPTPGSPFHVRQAVTCVSAEAASWYCKDQGKRLPTEEEWELAAGGRPKRWLPWDPVGSVRPECSDAVFGRVENGACQKFPRLPGWVEERNRDVTPEGVRALGGNVSEWALRGSRNHGVSAGFVARGGSWAGTAIDMHPTKVVEDLNAASADFGNIGFRCAISR